MSIKTKDILALFDEDDEADETVLECVDEGEWTSDGKYELKSDVYKHIPTGRFFCINSDRSGSYYSDYEYGERYCHEVKPVEVTVTQYVAIK